MLRNQLLLYSTLHVQKTTSGYEMCSGCIFNRTNHVKTGCHISYYNFRTTQYLDMKLETQRELEVLVNVCKVQLCSIPESTIFRRGDGTDPHHTIQG